ncbi:dehydrogenase/reductase SDR family member 11-like [Schistocerca nitens]|uniref:dehydrogenase/reductase SDR family member 11-like n=1 Tax=Schistocerca nitens TaxID=7011 RepID=UPI00211869BC|nr:dehydrogenase/reductase SDR family member 11-like [Schistocerca nitens]
MLSVVQAYCPNFPEASSLLAAIRTTLTFWSGQIVCTIALLRPLQLIICPQHHCLESLDRSRALQIARAGRQPMPFHKSVVYFLQARELKDAPGRLYPLQCDVSCEENVLRAFKWIKENLGGVDVLINSAGICRENLPTSGQTAEWRHTLDVNVLGLSVCTREAVQSMLDRGVDDGFVIHICSIAGHIMPFDPLCSMYHASKHAVKALLEGLRKDLVARNSKIRCGEISPGIVKRDIYYNLKKYSLEALENMHTPMMEPEDIANAVIYMLSQPPRVQCSQALTVDVVSDT